MPTSPSLAALALAVALTACSNGNDPSANNATVDLFVGVASGGASASGMAAPQAAETIELGGNTLVFGEVELVLRKVALQQQPGTDDCEDDVEEADESAGDDEADDDDACSVLKMGPVLVSLPLDGSTSRLFTIDAEPGTFRRLMFQLHKPSDDGDDAAFLALHPEFAGASVRVVGTFNGLPFVYTTDLTVVQHTTLSPPLVIDVAGTTDLTLEVDLSGWFTNQAGTALIDPATVAGSGQLDAQIRQNIRNSFRGRRGHGNS